MAMPGDKYRVNEIFYSLQGEGFWTGTPMVFVRLSGCNLRCPFCDTDFRTFREMSAAEIVTEVRRAGGDCRRICLTGGEPALQADAALIAAFHAAGFTVHMETNGTCPLPEDIDWVSFSPKSDFVSGGAACLHRADELKLVFAEGCDPARWADFPSTWHFLQPCDKGGTVETAPVIDYIRTHPRWRLSLQTHKLLNIR